MNKFKNFHSTSTKPCMQKYIYKDYNTIIDLEGNAVTKINKKLHFYK